MALRVLDLVLRDLASKEDGLPGQNFIIWPSLEDLEAMSQHDRNFVNRDDKPQLRKSCAYVFHEVVSLSRFTYVLLKKNRSFCMDLWDGAFFLTQPILKILLLDRLQIRHRLVYDFTVCRCSFLPFVCTGLSVFIYPKYSDISTPYHTCSKILTSTIYYPILWLKIAGWVANSVDPDETLHSVASHLGLHCLLSPVCIYPKYSDTSTPYHTCSKIWTSTIYCNLMNVYCHVKGWTSSSKIRF